MPDSTAEEAAHAHAKALIEGDMGTAFMGMTPDGLASAMEVGNTSWNIMSYEIDETREEGDDTVIGIAFLTDVGRMRLEYRFRDVDGVWKINHVARTP